MKYTPFYQKSSFNFGGQLKRLSPTWIMGILNLTPDSFYQNSRVSEDQILEKTAQMIEAGVDIIDVGGYSSRPGASDVSVQEETDRVIPSIELISKAFPECLISIDTFRAKVARQAAQAGAKMINDIQGGEGDPFMFDTVAELKLPYILMHMRGNPQNMQELTQYNDLLGELILYFSKKIKELKQKGVHDIFIDPGFGFSKSIQQNFFLLEHLSDLHILNTPILAGLSRKSFIYKSLGIKPDEALNGTMAMHVKALEQGVNILRVHDVKESKELVNLLTFMENE